MLVINGSEVIGSRFSKLKLTAAAAEGAVDATAFQLEAKTSRDLNGSPTTSTDEREHGFGQERQTGLPPATHQGVTQDNQQVGGLAGFH